MAEPLVLRVRTALSAVTNPATGRNIIAEGAVQGLVAEDNGQVRFVLELPEATRAQSEETLNAAKEKALAVSGVLSVSAAATGHSASGKTAPKPPAPHQATPGGHNNPLGMSKKPRVEEAGAALEGVGAVIAVTSGKGGVGKSTIAANLAVALTNEGFSTGLMDADIYGPSLPTLFGLNDKAVVKDGKIQPIEAFGVKSMSIGLLVKEDEALAWRGPMVMGAIRQLIGDVDWGPLDVLLIDTPPGTGDAHLSLIQSKTLSGAVVVSTPQTMALADVRRGVSLFRKTETPIIGVIENMAWLENSSGERQYLFGKGGAERAAEDLEAPFLGAVPLYPELREASDAGAPLAATDHPAAAQFNMLAKKLADFIRA